jgi:mediator of RNA polymerase II transcription subunit 5
VVTSLYFKSPVLIFLLDLRKNLSRALSSFIPYWTHASPQHVQNSARLELAQTSRSLVDKSEHAASQDGTMDVTAALQVDAVLDLPLIHTRPGIFLFISALVSHWPMVIPT